MTASDSICQGRRKKNLVHSVCEKFRDFSSVNEKLAEIWSPGGQTTEIDFFCTQSIEYLKKPLPISNLNKS